MNEDATRAVVERWFKALGEFDGEAALACIDDNVRWINNPAEEGKAGGIPGLSAIIPWLGDFSSKKDVVQSFVIWAKFSEVLKHEHLDILYKDDQAMAVAHEIARIKTTGMVYEIEFIQRLRVSGGKIVMLRAYWDSSRGVVAFRGDMPARLLDAARRGDSDAAEMVLPFGANPNQADPVTAESALMIAAGAGHAGMIKTLVSYGAEPNMISRNSGNTALHNACKAGNAESVQALLAAGAFVNIQCPATGETALHEALKHGFTECAEILVNSGADAGITAFDGRRPADIAASVLGPDAPILARLAKPQKKA